MSWIDSVNVLALLHAAVALGASVHVILHHPQARGAALWLCIIWLVPWLGPVFYTLVGVNRVHRKARFASPAETPSGTWTEGNQVRLLDGGDAAYHAMIADIDQATKAVYLATYIFDNDRAGALFLRAFERAIGRGVRVCVLIDAAGARYSTPSIVRALRRAKVEVRRFMPTATPWRWPYANLRNHRKVMVVDEQFGFIGGMNIRERCMASLAPIGLTRDLHFRVHGPIVAHLASLFVSDWLFSNGEPITLRSPPVESSGVSAARLIDAGPDHVDEPIRWLKLAAVVRASRKVRILTPYFVPDEDVVAALCAAASAGVRIQIVMPVLNNLRLVAWASRACWPRLVARGIELVLSPPPFDHSKVMIVDDDVAIVGSSNWDERSFRLNFEADLEIRDPELVRKLDATIDGRIAGSRPVSLDDISSWSLLTRLRDGTARLALPYL